MNPPDIALYVTSNNVDHGPLSLKETTERVQSGEFKPTDLAWHQGVSGWVPLKELPEWEAMKASPPLEKKEPPKLIPDESTPKMNLSEKKVQLRPGSLDQRKNGGMEEGCADNKEVEKPQGGGVCGKILIAFALLIFLATLLIMGWVCYKNWDEILIKLQ
jgi:hypothetical protein